MEVKMLLWISVLLSFFSLSYTLIRAQKTISTLIVRVDLLETSTRLQDREISEIKEDVNVLLSTETLSVTVDEALKTLETQVECLSEMIGKPQDLSDSLSDRIDTVEGQLERLLNKEYIEVDDLCYEVQEIIRGLNFTLELVKGGRR